MSTGVELATAWVRLVPSMNGLSGEVAKSLDGVDGQMESAGKKSGSKFSAGAKTAMIAGAAILATGVVKVFNTGMEELKFGEKLNAQTDVIAKNTGFKMATGDINDYTLALSKVSGISEEDLQSAGNEILKFGDVSETTYKRAIDSINDMGAAGKDTTGVGVALGKALADPAKAAGILKKQGVLLNEEQKKLIENFTASGDKAGAQGVILDALNSTYDGMAEKTGGTLEGNLNKLNNAFENVSGDLVAGLMPAITAVVDGLQKFTIWIGENQTLFNILLGVIGAIAVALGILTIVQWALNAAFLASPVTWIILAIIALIAIIILLVANWDAVVAFITDIWNGFVSWFIGIMDGFFGWWNGVWAGFIGFVVDIWSGFISWIMGVLMGFVGWWNGIWEGFAGFIKDVWTGFIGFIRDVWNSYLNWLKGVVDGFVGWWNGVWAGIGNVIKDVFGGIGDFIGGIWNGIITGIRRAVNTIIKIVNSLIDGINAVVGAVGGAMGLSLKIPHIPGLYQGGSITRAGTVLVGERGPELLNLPKGASVDPDISHLNNSDGGVTFINYAPLGQSPAQALTEFSNRAKGLK